MHTSVWNDTKELVEAQIDWSSEVVSSAPQIRGRAFLPGSESPKFPELLSPPRTGDAPRVFVPSGSVGTLPEDCAVEVRRVVHDLMKTRDEGAVLFRGLPLSTTQDFSRVVNNLGLKMTRSYKGGIGIRRQTDESVYTASDEPPEWCIEPHNELAQSNNSPEKVIFFCVDPPCPGAGGETVLTDVRQILPRLDKKVVKKFRELRVMYKHYVPSRGHGEYLCWQTMFQTEDRSVVEEFLRTNNIQWTWENNNALLWWIILPAVRMYRGTLLWFNSAHINNITCLKLHPHWCDKDIPDHCHPTNTFYGDGTDIETEVLQHIRDVTWQLAVGFQMKKGDLLVLNNMYCQHARLSYTGTRKLAFAMGMQDD
ncbi:dapdiamide synthesis protein DdaC-like [Branchiostoma lanceolatum]|uniref:dapdiamide synthesis protein DdaC-like n=1 Tax=Branchiostoma lanceolatum TaxID=7740 RepID=UPI0034539109